MIDAQSKVISQLKTLLAYQTKPACRLGHYGCYIDHKRYNFVKLENESMPSRPNKNSVKFDPMKLCPGDKISPLKLSRKVDYLQSVYGVPPSLPRDLSEDLIAPEFLAIWENVLSFKHHVLKSTTVEAKFQPRSQPKSKWSHTSIILENRPLKFKSEKSKGKPSCQTKNSCQFKPMSDSELGKALNLDEIELARAFGYDVESDNVKETIENVFQDEDY